MVTVLNCPRRMDGWVGAWKWKCDGSSQAAPPRGSRLVPLPSSPSELALDGAASRQQQQQQEPCQDTLSPVRS